MRRKTIILVSAAFIALISGLLLLRPAVLLMAGFLTKSERVDANILIIEGWLSFDDLKLARDEFLSGKYDVILTTGLRATREFYNINTDGYLIFYPRERPLKGVSKVEVRAASELEGENSAHFNLWINDSITGEFHADKHNRLYAVSWNRSSIDSVMVQFDNDIAGEFGDRNLYVSEVIFDGEQKLPFLNNSVYDISGLDNLNRIVNNMTSNAELTEKRLVTLGIDSSAVLALPGEKVRINRTLTSAIAVRDFLKKSDIRVSGINIISSGSHSRRTWITFKKVLDIPEPVGIIALRDRSTDEVRIFKTFRETVAFIWYFIMLIPY